jgi:molybdopterin-guanine dinucleotide biosynthesis protein A
VDRVIASDGTRFHVAPAAFDLHDGQWALRENATAIVLAGGSGTRMGRDKRLLTIGNTSLVQNACTRLADHFAEVLVSANDPATFAGSGFRVVPDRRPGVGPLMGVASALAAARHDAALAVACDIPQFDVRLVHRLLSLAEGCEIAVPRTRAGDSAAGALYEPLFAVYRKSVLPRMEALLAEGVRRLRPLFDQCRTRFLDIDGVFALENLNTMEEYRAYVARHDATV